jgi:hypothetical protein
MKIRHISCHKPDVIALACPQLRRNLQTMAGAPGQVGLEDNLEGEFMDLRGQLLLHSHGKQQWEWVEQALSITIVDFRGTQQPVPCSPIHGRARCMAAVSCCARHRCEAGIEIGSVFLIWGVSW